MNQLIHFVVIIAALSGFLLSFYIFKKKRKQEVMTCPIGSDCNSVVHSDYSKFFGIPLELVGIFYYGLTLAAYSLIYAVPASYSPSASFILILLSTDAFLFSLYLTAIQGIVLKQWCTWCLTSAFLSTLIFAGSLAISDWSFVALLGLHGGIIFLVHLGAIALGVGIATIADIFFLKFLKDFKISVSEADILRTFGQALWFALSIVVLTSLGLLLPNMDIAWSSPQFAVEMFVLLIIVMNAVYLTLVVYPRLVALSFDKERFETKEQDRAKKLAFASGAISLVSWYFILFLTSPIEISLSTPRLIMVYVGLVAIALGTSQIVHDKIESEAKKKGY